MAEILTGSDLLKGYSFSSSWTFPPAKEKTKRKKKVVKIRYTMHFLSFHNMFLQSMGMNLLESVTDSTVTFVTMSTVKTITLCCPSYTIST